MILSGSVAKKYSFICSLHDIVPTIGHRPEPSSSIPKPMTSVCIMVELECIFDAHSDLTTALHLSQV